MAESAVYNLREIIKVVKARCNNMEWQNTAAKFSDNNSVVFIAT
jgi:hypothetical protein